MADFTGGDADDVFNAPATSATTGAAVTTVNSGDAINGGAGSDTLNITATVTNNNSLSGLTATAVETVNIAGGNYLGASSPALAAAQANKTATAAALATKQAELNLASQQLAAATKVDAASATATAGEDAVVALTAATVANAATRLAAAIKVTAIAGADVTTAAGESATAFTARYNALSTEEKASFSEAEFKAAINAATKAQDGSTIATAATIEARADVLAGVAQDVANLVNATTVSDATAAQQLAAATYVATLAGGDVTTGAALTGTQLTAAYTALNNVAFTEAQYKSALVAATKAYDGSTIAVAATIEARADVLVANATAVQANASDYTVAQLNSAASAATKAADGSSLLTLGNDSAAIVARAAALKATATTVRGDANAASTAALNADVAAANSVTVALANVSNTSIAASQFADATVISLSGDSGKANVTAVAATQTIVLDGVAGLENSIGFGATVTTGLIASKGAAGTLTATGAAMTALNISGTGSAGLTLVDGSSTDTIKTINVNTTAGTVLDVAGTTAVTAVNSTGAGGLTLASAGVKVASVTTGEGADLIKVTTTTAADNAGTTIDETVNTSVSTAGGNDTVVVAVTGDGKTSVNTGAGNDTVRLDTLSTGANTVTLGDGTDTLRIGAISSLASTKVDGGTGTDTLVTTTTAFGLNEYTILSANVVGVEGVKFSSAVTALDASKTGFTTFEFNAGANTITEVSSAQSINLARQAKVSATTGFTAEIADTRPTGLTASSKGYLVAAGIIPTAYGDNLSITANQVAAGTTLALTANKATVGVSALAATSTVTGVASTVVVSGDLKALDATLTSVRGSGTTYGGDEWVAGATVTVVAGGSLAALETIKIGGSGSVTINASQAAAAAAKLTSIDLSGMTAFADQNVLGQQVNGNTVGGFDNKSVSSVTLNNNVSETVILGGAKDTVVTGSTVLAMDTITGFQLTASAADPLVVDTTRSDVLDLANAFTGGVKMTTTATTLDAAILEAANLVVGGAAKDNVVFHFGGNTYVYQDLGTAGLTNDDVLVKMSGTLNLDLLLQANVIV